MSGTIYAYFKNVRDKCFIFFTSQSLFEVNFKSNVVAATNVNTTVNA